MARKKMKNSDVEVHDKTLEELTDSEFLIGAERLSEPFYIDYISAPAEQYVSVDGYVSDTQLGILAKNATTRVTTQKSIVEESKTPQKGSQKNAKEEKPPKKYIRKHIIPLILILILCFALLAVAVLGVVPLGIGDYVALFKSNDSSISMTALDPVFGLVYSLMKNKAPEGYDFYDTIGNEYEAIPVYSVSCAMILFLLCVVILFIKVWVALLERAMGGYYKKRKFGYTAIVALFSALVVLVGGIYLLGGDIMGIMSFVQPDNVPYTFGYGLYCMIGASLLIAILSGFAYKKEKVPDVQR